VVFRLIYNPDHGYWLDIFRSYNSRKGPVMFRIPSMFLMLLLLLDLVTAATAAPSRIDVYYLDQTTALPVPATPENVLELLYQSKAGSALALADSLVKTHPGDPLTYLIKARVLRETLPEVDDDRGLIRSDAEPIHDLLDRALDLCKSDRGVSGGDTKRLFYQGWAWMFKAQLHALGGSYWSAGRAAARGNRDLKKYLAKHPEDPDTQGILGMFLYFADTLPTAAKIAKTLLLIPGGDRQKGLAYLQYAAGHKCILQTDHRITQASIFLIFEGRFEDGIQEYLDLQRQYPNYLRLIEQLGILSSFNPVNYRSLRDLEVSAVVSHARHRPEDIDENTLLRLRYHRAYAGKFFEPARAVQAFNTLIDDWPARPDWVVPLSLINLGCLEANSGNPEFAAARFEQVMDSPRMSYFHDFASNLLDRQSSAENLYLGDHSGVASSIYTSDTRTADDGLSDYQRRVGQNIFFDFYSGEARLLRGDLDAAAGYYRKTLDQKLPVYAQSYKMLAASRLAEIAGARGQYRLAEDYLDRALDYYQKEFLADMLIKGRRHYYHRLAEGELGGTPSILEPLPVTCPTSPGDAR
jgi:tetratricopeptide (TPR) repeat protein